MVNATPCSAGHRLRAKSPAFLSRRMKSLRRSRTSTAGVSPRTDVFGDMGAARVDMLLLVNRKRERRTERELARGGGRTSRSPGPRLFRFITFGSNMAGER